MSSHKGVCQPFYGDKYMNAFFKTDKGWRTGNNIQNKCNAIRKGTTICYELMNGKISAASYNKAYAFAYSPLSFVNSSANICITKWFNNVYPAIKPGGENPPGPKPGPEPAPKKTCTNYVCETQSHSPGAGNCALYVTNETGGDTVYLANDSCPEGKVCSPFIVNSKNITAPCAFTPKPPNNQSLVNEPCPSGDPATDCWVTADLPKGVYFKPTCRNNVCSDFINVGEPCTETQQCEPALFCNISPGETVGTCTALKVTGTSSYSN
jgi:hypothetical protein